MTLYNRIEIWIKETIGNDKYNRSYDKSIITRIENYAKINNLEYLLVEDIMYMYFQWIGIHEPELIDIIKEFKLIK